MKEKQEGVTFHRPPISQIMQTSEEDIKEDKRGSLVAINAACPPTPGGSWAAG